jgi:general secretion pathway protein M
MATATQQLTELRARFATLTERERLLLLGAGVAVLAFITFLIVFNFSSGADRIRRGTQHKLQLLTQVQEAAATYRDAKSAQEAVEQRLAGNNVRLISYLEEKAQKAGLDIPSINPKAEVTLEGDKIVESAAEFTLTDVQLNRLTDFLQSVEASPGIIRVKYLRLEPRPAQETVTAWVQVATYRLKK